MFMAAFLLLMTIPAGEMAATIVHDPDSPVRLDRARIFNVVADEPAVLMYAATNQTDNDLEQFTVVVFIFDSEGTLKARQSAPARRTLEKRSTKFSAMVLDGWRITATDRIVFGVNQVLRADSEKWWHAELDEAARAAVAKPQRP
jgi:hypothetical protein